MKRRNPNAEAVAEFRARVEHWSKEIRVRPRQVRLQRMHRKWASCSTAGTVSFNLDVLDQPAAFRDYVIVHELLHLKVPNHGKLFKSLLRAYLPDCDKDSAYAALQPAPK